VGGVSHSLVESPSLPFAPWITYGKCETSAQGLIDGTSTRTILTASVENVQVKTRPSPEDDVKDIKEIALLAKKLSLSVESLHPADKEPTFKLGAKPIFDGLSIRFTPKSGKSRVLAFELDFGHPLMEDVPFSEYARQCKSLPRDVGGYVVTSIVKGFRIDGKDYQGNEYFTPGFGRVIFGTLRANEHSRRLTLVHVRMGSDPKGSSDHCDVDTNGVMN